MRRWLFFILFSSSALAQAFSWKDLWATDDQQAQALMTKGQYKKAQQRFQQPDWQAAAAYRSGNYEQAAKTFGTLNTQQGYYNQGNALAHMGQYEEAIKAYDDALRINPNDPDALHNRKVVEALLKNEQDKQQNQQGNNQQNQQNPDQQGNNQQNQQNPDQQGNNQQNQQNPDQQGDNQQNQKNPDQQGDNQQNQQNPDQQGNNQQNQQNPDQQGDNQQNQKNPDQQGNNQQDNNERADQNQIQTQESEENREKQQAKEQWLNLIPDDPGGLMREKFLRDHLKRKRGWYQ